MLASDLAQDVRFAIRTLIRQPAFAAVALLTLAVGIGATTAVFSVVNGVLLRPLPYPNADRLVMVFRTVPRYGFDRSTASYPDFADWRAGARGLARLAAYAPTGMTYVTPDGAERLSGYRVTANLGSVLGVPPSLGRWFTEADDRPEAEPVIVLSNGLWRSRFGGDSTIMGRSITLDGVPRVVVGVMPSEFAFPSDAATFWVPLAADATQLERESNFLTVIARLAPGVTVASAQRRLGALAARIDAEAPGANEGYGLFVEPRHAFVVGDSTNALYLFLGAVTLVLLIACANVTNLLLARGAARARELAVRAALGAGRARLIRQLLGESLVLGLGGGALGIGVGWVVLRAFVKVGTGQLPRVGDVRLDLSALAIALAISVICALIFGTVGAWTVARREPSRWLGEGTARATGTGQSGRRLQRAFVVMQVAVAAALSLGAGLLVNSFMHLTAVNPGFQPTNLVAGRVTPRFTPPALGPNTPDSVADRMFQAAARARVALFDEIRSRIAAAAGIEATTLMFDLPFATQGFSRPAVPEGRVEEEDQAPAIAGNVIAGDFLRTLRIPLLRGRAFDASDTPNAPPVALVNATLANAFWPGQDPVGKRMRLGGPDNPWTTVVGVVGDVHLRSLAEAREPIYYRPLSQATWVQSAYVVVRSSGPTASTVAAMRRAVRELDPSLPITSITTATELIAESVRAPRFRALVLGIFGLAAVIVAVAGVYGVIAHSVSTRRREMGIRIALGAVPAGLVGSVVRDGLFLATAGLALGVGGAIVLSRFLRRFLFGVGPLDPTTFVAVVMGVGVVATIACYVPARRAASADPLETMRTE